MWTTNESRFTVVRDGPRTVVNWVPWTPSSDNERTRFVQSRGHCCRRGVVSLNCVTGTPSTDDERSIRSRLARLKRCRTIEGLVRTSSALGRKRVQPYTHIKGGVAFQKPKPPDRNTNGALFAYRINIIIIIIIILFNLLPIYIYIYHIAIFLCTAFMFAAIIRSHTHIYI